MLKVTEAAGAYLVQLLDQQSAGDGVAVRLEPSVEGDEFALQLGHPQSDDVTVDFNGRIVLAFNDETARSLGEQMLDVEETDKGPVLSLIGPASPQSS